MRSEKILPILKGILSFLLPLQRFKTPPATGGTISSRYCYAVWMRHLVTAHQNGLIDAVPHTIAELGPGDSIGTGLAALLSGSEKYYALDIYQYWDTERNLKIFDELVELFRNRAAVPGEEEFPRFKAGINEVSFPSALLTDEMMKACLADERVAQIRKEIGSQTKPREARFIHCYAPWTGKDIIPDGSVDMIFSQSVLEYVDDLGAIYKTMNEWLRTGGIMSHNIDLSSIGLTKEWNGHWTYTPLQWKLYKGKRIMCINRAPKSRHLALIEENGFELKHLDSYYEKNNLPVLAAPFDKMDEDDRSCKAIFIQYRKANR